MRYIYIILIIIILYYIFTNLLQTYLNQENFDSTLVPVPSIVSLAQIVKHIVNIIKEFNNI